MIDERQKQLKDGLLLFEPKRFLARIGDVRDIFEHRHLLKQVRFSPKTAEHLAHLILDALKAGKRFRVFDSLKVLRAVVIAGSGRPLSASTVESLFEIYNRSRYNAGNLSERRSELIAILLRDEEIDALDGEDTQVLAWAIMQSASRWATKVEQLSSLARRLPAEALVTFANRLNAPVILRHALKSVERVAPRRRQALAANGAIDVFSSNLVSFSLNAHRAPQLRRDGIMFLPSINR